VYNEIIIIVSGEPLKSQWSRNLQHWSPIVRKFMLEKLLLDDYFWELIKIQSSSCHVSLWRQGF